MAALSGSGPADPVRCRDCEPSYQERRLVCNPLPSLPWITFPREAELAQFAASEERRSCAFPTPLSPVRLRIGRFTTPHRLDKLLDRKCVGIS